MPSKTKKTLSQLPPRSYQIPGGPQAKNLAPTTVKVLAHIQRGGDEDRSGNRGR